MERADLEQWKAREVARLLGLVETERRYYQEIAASIPVGVLVLSPDLTIISANRAIRRMFALSGASLRARVDTLLPGWVLDRVAEVLKSGVPQTNIMVAEARTGRRLRVGIIGIQSWDDESSPEALVSIEDLSGLGDVPVPAVPSSGAELTNLSAVVWTLDLANDRFVVVSPNATRLLGYPAQHWTSTPSFWTQRVHEADRDWVTQAYRNARDGQSLEFRAIASDGRVVWLRESFQILADSQGRPRYLTGLSMDVTERRMLQDQLVQAERSQAVSKLSGRLAHDLNNMLMIVTGHSEELLNSLPANSPLRADVQEILNATERMSGLTGHLLSFTRRQSSTAVSVSLNEVLGVVERKLGLPPKHSVRPMVVKADAERLEELLTWLVEQQRQVNVETSHLEIREDLNSATETLRPGSYAVTAITLPERAFDPDAKSSWFEAILPAKDSDPWPLALTRAYGTVRQWGGDIVASAAPEGGTLVRVFLESADDPGNREPVSAAKPATAEPGLTTILVVEDETAIRELVLKILRRHGYQALEAANGEEALALCREHSGVIDLLITDVMMPRMGGPELVDRLRKQGINPKVLYVSGFTGDANLSARNVAPGTAFVEKPFTLQALLAKVQEVLSSGS
ncbi:MAG TPA: response regulator [Bryobacteraceae bacterium]|nr:response regulator [Bryobacteraceae bacterium]